jgi:hypothetical protein
MMRTLLLLLIATLLGLSGCAERGQDAASTRAYQGRADTQSWDNAPLSYEQAKWTQGDRASWEAEIKTRQLAQNEYKRMGQ